MFLHVPPHIEALLCCHFIAMLIYAPIERQIRQAMKSKGIKERSICPEDRACATPTAARVLDIFDGLASHQLIAPTGHLVQTFPPQLTELQYSSSCSTCSISHSATTPNDPARTGQRASKQAREVRKVSDYVARKVNFRMIVRPWRNGRVGPWARGSVSSDIAS